MKFAVYRNKNEKKAKIFDDFVLKQKRNML